MSSLRRIKVNKMSRSSLIDKVILSPNYTKMTNKINKKITIHHMAGNLSIESCGKCFQGTRQASSNYGIDSDGRVGLYVEESNRSWASSNKANDAEAVTIEVANSMNHEPWAVSDAAYNKLIDLCLDICKRNNISKLVYTGGVDGNLTEHRMFKATACPGTYLHSHMNDIANAVNRRLGVDMSSSIEKVLQLTPIMGTSSITPEAIKQAFYDNGAGTFTDIIEYFFMCEEKYNVRADLAICQSILETGWFKFKGYVKPEWNNFAGLGATDKDANKNIATFPNRFLGVVAQCQHLLAYATDLDPVKIYNGWAIVDPRFNLVTRKSAQYVEHLGQQENPLGKGWATGKDYGKKIIDIYNDIYNKYMKKEDIENEEVKEETKVEDLTKREDVPDYKVQVVPTKINLFDNPNGKIIGVVTRAVYTIIEEQDGYGLLEDKSGWVQLGFCNYLNNVE